MDVALAFLVFLLGACLGVLAGCYVALSRIATLTARTTHQLSIIAEQVSGTRHGARQLALEQIQHRDASLAILVDRMQCVGRGLAAEIQEAARQQRHAIRMASLAASTSSADAPTPPSGYPSAELLSSYRERSQ